MSKIRNLIKSVIYFLFRLLPVRKKQVLMFSYYGEQYSGSPKYISLNLQKKDDVKVIWAFTDLTKHPQYDGKKVKYSGLKYYYYLATSEVIITNYRMTEEFKKRNCQKYIQTWHSSLRLKMIENDAKGSLPENYIKMAKNDSKQIDFLLAGSQKSREIFENSFWYNGKIVNTGTPSCDILLGDTKAYKKKVCDFFNISQNSYIAMYAPTFRKDHRVDVYDINPNAIINALKKRFGSNKDWYLLIRLHPHLIGKLNCFAYGEKVLQATDYDDVQELLCATDFLISDYSAIMFDFSVTKKKCVLYTPDIESYIKNDRKLYFEIESLPFPCFKSANELEDGIINFDEDKYSVKIDDFLNTIGSFDDGQASERVYKLIKGENV